jgi:hypothetical protein
MIETLARSQRRDILRESGAHLTLIHAAIHIVASITLFRLGITLAPDLSGPLS